MLITAKPEASIALTMTSREIAELVESNHADVKRSIDRLASKGVIAIPPSAGYLDSLGRAGQTEYRLDKRSSYIVAAQLCPEFTARLVDRWQELEEKAAKPAFALPDFTNPAQAARAWADAIEASQALAIERDHAIATKAQIGNRREATSMATASAARKETAKLRALMGEATKSASILAVQGKTGIPYNWRNLKNYCTAAGLRMGKSFNPGLQLTVNTYPAEAWFEVYGVDLVELFGKEVQQ